MLDLQYKTRKGNIKGLEVIARTIHKIKELDGGEVLIYTNGECFELADIDFADFTLKYRNGLNDERCEEVGGMKTILFLLQAIHDEVKTLPDDNEEKADGRI